MTQDTRPDLRFRGGVPYLPPRTSEDEARTDAEFLLAHHRSKNKPLFPADFSAQTFRRDDGLFSGFVALKHYEIKKHKNTWKKTGRETIKPHDQEADSGCKWVDAEQWHAIQVRQHLRGLRGR